MSVAGSLSLAQKPHGLSEGRASLDENHVSGGEIDDIIMSREEVMNERPGLIPF